MVLLLGDITKMSLVVITAGSPTLPQADRHRPNRSEICALLRRCGRNDYRNGTRPHTRRAVVEVRSDVGPPRSFQPLGFFHQFTALLRLAAKMAATNKYLARSNKSRTGTKATKRWRSLMLGEPAQPSTYQT
jgi:hypothetical protein